nr:MAG TPA: hypothetical protein [Herelleviridae sp.]DAV33287.1 MAG TPA: hypothetical protein [Caudoviricetes sp.]
MQRQGEAMRSEARDMHRTDMKCHGIKAHC